MRQHKLAVTVKPQSTSAIIACTTALAAIAAAPVHAEQASPATPASSAPLTLRDSLTMALRNSPATEQARLGIDQAQARYEVAKQATKPTYSANAHASAVTSPEVTVTSLGGTSLINRERERATVGMQYTLYDAGRRRYDAEAAREEVAAATAMATGSATDLMKATSLAYYNAIHARSAVDVGELDVKSAEDDLDRAKTRFAIGTVTRSDVLAATSALDSAKSDLEARKLNLQEADAALASLIGVDPSKPLSLAPAPPPDFNLSGDIDQLVRQAEDASAQRKQIEAARAAAVAALNSTKAANKPVVTLTAEVGSVAIQRPGRGAWAYTSYGLIGASVSAPLFNGASQRALERAQLDQVKAQEVAQKQLAIELKQQIATGVAAYKSALTRADIAKDTVDNSAQAYQFAQDKYSAGKATEVDVIQTQEQLSIARDEYQQAVDDRDTALQNLRWLIGLDQPDAYVTPATHRSAP